MILLALGQKGCGKSLYLTRRTVEYARNNPTTPVFIRDLRGWTGGPTSTVGALAPEGARFTDLADFERRGVVDGRLRHRVNLFWRCDADDLFTVGRRYCLQLQPCLLVCDELDQVPNPLTQKHPAYHCLHYGRFPGVSTFGSARQPQDIAKAWILLIAGVKLHQPGRSLLVKQELQRKL